jgi:hypothetical protein
MPVALILPEGAGWRLAGSVMTLLTASSRIGFCIASSRVAYLSTMAMSSTMVAGSERMSLCFSRVPSLQPSEKYWIACTSWTPSQVLRSAVQQVR